MKYLLHAFLLNLLLIHPVEVFGEGKHLFVLSGQSNMVGLDPEISFKPNVAAALGRDNVIVVQDAMSGQPILRWYKKWKLTEGERPKITGDLYDRLMEQVHLATRNQKLITVTFVWMQGEQDAMAQYGEVYAESIRGLIRQLSQDLGHQDINFVIGRLSDFDMKNKYFPHWTMVRDAQMKVAESSPFGAWVNTDDLNDVINIWDIYVKNDLHYTKEGYQLLGQRFADKAIELIQRNDLSGSLADMSVSQF